MTAPIKNNQAPKNDPYADAYGANDDGYDNYEGADFAMETGDEFIDGEESGAPSAPLTASSLRQSIQDLKDLMNVSDLKPKQKAAIEKAIEQLQGKINSTINMRPELRDKVLGSLSQKIFELEGQIMNPAENGASGTLSDELQAYKEKIKANANIPQSSKDEMVKKIDGWIANLDLEPTEAELTKIGEDFSDLQEDYTEISNSPAGATSLSKLTDSEPKEIEEAAKKHGLDLNKMPNPPTQAVFEFLKEISKTFEGKLAAVEKAVGERNKEIGDSIKAAKDQNAANTRCTSDNDNTDTSAFQKLYDLKYHQDPKAQDIARLMKDATGEAAKLLQALYPQDAASIKLPDAPAGTDWQALDQKYKQADKINFGGGSIDLFDNTSGSLGASDAEIPVEIVTIKYDWNGDGDWGHHNDPSVKSYGEGAAREVYDNG